MEATTEATDMTKAEEKKRRPPRPIEVDVLGDGLLMLGAIIRTALKNARLPPHYSRQHLLGDLVRSVCLLYSKERERVLQQRQQLRQLHRKILEQKGMLLSKEGTITKLANTVGQQKVLIEEMKRNR